MEKYMEDFMTDVSRSLKKFEFSLESLKEKKEKFYCLIGEMLSQAQQEYKPRLLQKEAKSWWVSEAKAFPIQNNLWEIREEVTPRGHYIVWPGVFASEESANAEIKKVLE